MTTTMAREWSWHETEAADAFVASAESRGTDLETMHAIARLAEDTDEAVAIWDFITEYRRAGR
jgi:cytidylate kinase